MGEPMAHADDVVAGLVDPLGAGGSVVLEVGEAVGSNEGDDGEVGAVGSSEGDDDAVASLVGTVVVA
jgi:hypothetical protein